MLYNYSWKKETADSRQAVSVTVSQSHTLSQVLHDSARHSHMPYVVFDRSHLTVLMTTHTAIIQMKPVAVAQMWKRRACRVVGVATGENQKS